MGENEIFHVLGKDNRHKQGKFMLGSLELQRLANLRHEIIYKKEPKWLKYSDLTHVEKTELNKSGTIHPECVATSPSHNLAETPGSTTVKSGTIHPECVATGPSDNPAETSGSTTVTEEGSDNKWAVWLIAISVGLIGGFVCGFVYAKTCNYMCCRQKQEVRSPRRV